MDRKRLLLLIPAVFCITIGVVWMAGDYVRKERQAREYASLAEAVKVTEEETSGEEISIAEPETTTEPETEAAYVSPIDFEELWKINPDVVGWITIPDTKIDYPILQAEDNETYLHTDIDGNDSVAGAIYLDFEDESDFSSLHNVIYGHHMKNGSMFKDVVKYKEQPYFDQHSDIYIYTPDREIHLKALAALYTTPDGIRRKTSFRSEEEFDAYVEQMTGKAITSAEPVNPVGKLYSLITCSYEFQDARTILYAYEVDEPEIRK
ncbi:MAG: class B sortase [Lachnospiraceae bacterium]|nr:class B sortase [Lachnospiraceae bacterium]